MDRFPALRLIRRYGRIGSAIFALLAAAVCVWALWGTIGAWALLATPFVLVVAYYLAKSYVEIVQIVTEMVV
jgi:hypothetical protein